MNMAQCFNNVVRHSFPPDADVDATGVNAVLLPQGLHNLKSNNDGHNLMCTYPSEGYRYDDAEDKKHPLAQHGFENTTSTDRIAGSIYFSERDR